MTNANMEARMAGAPRKLWGAKGIGRAIGRSESFVRKTLARMPDSPVHRFNRELWADEDELFAFFDRLASRK
jgi:hypothetical protein